MHNILPHLINLSGVIFKATTDFPKNSFLCVCDFQSWFPGDTTFLSSSTKESILIESSFHRLLCILNYCLCTAYSTIAVSQRCISTSFLLLALRLNQTIRVTLLVLMYGLFSKFCLEIYLLFYLYHPYRSICILTYLYIFIYTYTYISLFLFR